MVTMGKQKTSKGMLQLEGHATLTVTDPKTGKVIKRITTHNLIVSVGKYYLGDMLIDKDAGHDTGLTYTAIGTDNTAPVIADTTLGSEQNRKQITSRTRNAKEITLSTFFTAAESTYNIKEAGIFGHSTATGSADSGKLFAHWLVSYDNSGGNYDMTFDYVLTIG